MGFPELKTKDPVIAQGARLVDVDALPASGVVEVQTQEHGTLAVGMADGEPFAVGNVCRHQFAKLGQGQVVDGCLECPWHRARYDVRTGAMVNGPQGRIWGFPPYSRAVQAFGNTVRIQRFDVGVRAGAIWLT
jgi:nitrite reductase/ring-hydroxylating ferredoxin subunit